MGAFVLPWACAASWRGVLTHSVEAPRYTAWPRLQATDEHPPMVIMTLRHLRQCLWRGLALLIQERQLKSKRRGSSATAPSSRARQPEPPPHRSRIPGTTVGIIMGGIWAHEAWGRFWGWDAKDLVPHHSPGLRGLPPPAPRGRLARPQGGLHLHAGFACVVFTFIESISCRLHGYLSAPHADMELLLAGLNHKSGVPASARVNLAAVGAHEFLRRLSEAGWAEAVVLSTCNRLEVYAVIEDAGQAKAGLDALSRVLESAAGSPLAGHLYLRSGFDAGRHLFAVASGLDSLVTGENEILGQVKTAYETAFTAGTTGKLTNIIFQRAIFVGRKARTDTGISAGQLSVASVAAALAERIFGTLTESFVLILGAGQMAEIAARHLLSAKPAKLQIANRTHERGVALAETLHSEAVRWEDFPPARDCGIVLASTGAPEPVLTRVMVEAALPAAWGARSSSSTSPCRATSNSVGDLDPRLPLHAQDARGLSARTCPRATRRSPRSKSSWMPRPRIRGLDGRHRAGEQASLRHHPGRSLRRGGRIPPGPGSGSRRNAHEDPLRDSRFCSGGRPIRLLAELCRLHPGLRSRRSSSRPAGTGSLLPGRTPPPGKEKPNVKAMFVKELEEALLAGTIDFAIHSSRTYLEAPSGSWRSRPSRSARTLATTHRKPCRALLEGHPKGARRASWPARGLAPCGSRSSSISAPGSPLSPCAAMWTPACANSGKERLTAWSWPRRA